MQKEHKEPESTKSSSFQISLRIELNPEEEIH